MKAWNLLLILSLLISLLFISSCGKGAECSGSSECATGNSCILGRCKEGECVNTIKPDCCGNAKCEADAGENKCTCDQDCGKCEGKAKYTIETSRGPKEIDAKHATYLCKNSQCIVGVDPASVTAPSFTSDTTIRGGFEAEIVTTLNQPFDTSKDKINIRLKLKNINENVVDGVSFTLLQVVSGNELIGEKEIDNKLSSVGDVFVEEITISPAQSIVETEKNLDFNFDYEYTAVERGEPVTRRATIKNRVSNMIIIVP
ncbi:hypothetical protein KY348_04675 [Candidatus Woesearchaeota archaeon]|nr:hypothetical protein [Candidatus Woesearchaeota archaeon]